MRIQEAIIKHLAGDTTDATDAQDTAVTALIALVGSRIYPVVAPNAAIAPRVVYQCISDPIEHTMGVDMDDRFPRYQFTCVGPGYLTATQVAGYLVTALKDYTGTMGGEGGVEVDRVLIEERGFDIYDPQAAAQVAGGEIIYGVHSVIVEAVICYE